MANRRGFFERDRHGRERVVLTRSGSRHRSHSHQRLSTTHELLNEAEERESILIAENQSLRTQLSFAQANEWGLRDLQEENRRLRDEHHGCRNMRAQLEAQVREVRRVEDKLEDAEVNNERFQEKIRLLKRGRAPEGWRERYEEKVREVEILRRRLLDKDEVVRLRDLSLLERNRTVAYLRGVLREYGIRVEG